MNIDLLFTDELRAGLISDSNLIKKAAGVLLDTQTGLLTLEYVDMDFEELNIPVDSDFFQAMDRNTQIHIGAVKDGKIAQAYQIPLMFLDDPYRGNKMGQVKQSPNPLLAFEFFIKHATNGQPVHRNDLGDDAGAGCVLGDSMPSSLQFAPHLARQRAMEAAPKAQPDLTLGPSTPGLGGGGGGRIRQTRNTQPPKESDE